MRLAFWRRNADRPRRHRRLLFAGLGAIVVGLLAVIVIRAAFFYPSRQVEALRPAVIELRPGYAERLGRAIQRRTIADNSTAFPALRTDLEREYPNVHESLERQIVEDRTLLFRWAGTDPSIAPILLMSHIDVVPVEEGTDQGWTHPPFAGDVADGFTWGRGTLDVKCGAVGLMEAVEWLLARGFRPSGDVYLALGHDEETGGRGNTRVAAILRERGIRLRFVLDEGGALTEGVISGINRPVAFVGIAEKGYATIRITAKTPGGHSSMPPQHTAVGMAAAVVAAVEADPFPTRIDGATSEMLDYLGPEMGWPQRLALANRWLTAGLVARQFAAVPSMNAMIRTTQAATVFHGGVKDNVLPEQAEALVNLRLLPGETVQSALERVQNIASGLHFGPEAVSCSLDGHHNDPSPVSPIDSVGFRTLHRTIAEIFPEAVVAPGLCMAATDSRHFTPIAREIYRFLPVRLTSSDLERIHGVDERIGVETYEDLIRFLTRLIENFTSN